jgi:hypothetical protein
MEVIISIVSLLVIITVTVVLLYQNASVRDNTSAKMQSMVEKINDANYYTFQYDKKQEHNIKTLDDNINTVAGDVGNVNNDLQAFKTTVVSKKDLAESVATKRLTTDDLALRGYTFRDDGEGKWLRLEGGDGKFKDGWAMDKLYVEKEATIKGDARLDKIFGTSLQVAGGKNEYNQNAQMTRFPGVDGINRIYGNTEIAGKVALMGEVNVDKSINTRDTVKIAKDQFGLFIENKAPGENGAVMGLGSYGNNEFRMANGSTLGQLSFGVGSDKTYDPLMMMNRTNTERIVRLGGANGLRVVGANNDDITLRTEGNMNSLTFQTGTKPGIGIKDGQVSIGTAGDIARNRMDVYGNMSVRGNEMRLGFENQIGGNTGESRAMVKNDSELIFNYKNDFPGGSTFHSDISVVDGKCVEVGKNVANKDSAAGKICYNAFNSGAVDIVGAGTSKSQRAVRVWDKLETDKVKTSEMCLNNVCMTDSDLMRFHKSLPPTGQLCVGTACLTEADIMGLKKKLL